MATGTRRVVRDAERSREAILSAAERFFADHGYEGASLNDIAGQAGLSRGTPSYFFGSKDQLYVEVIERIFAAREQATREAFASVHEWCRGSGDLAELRLALTAAAEDYLAFLANRPSFVKLIMREELAGAGSIRQRSTRSTAMEDAFTALGSAGTRRGLHEFAVADAVLLFVALTFAPISYSNSLMRAVRRDLSEPAARRQQAELAVDQLLHLIAA